MLSAKTVDKLVHNYVIQGLVIAGLAIGGVIVTSLIVRYTPDLLGAYHYLRNLVL